MLFRSVAKETGIDEVHAKLLPQDKLSELQKIRSQHEHVMFVGDGINDAPVLAGRLLRRFRGRIYDRQLVVDGVHLRGDMGGYHYAHRA